MKPEVIIALDVGNFQRAKHIVDLLYPQARFFKVGLELFTACGKKIIRYIKKKGAKVFLDLKFFDIPNTVAGASREAVRLGVTMFTVHAQAGLWAMHAALKAAQDEAAKSGAKLPLIVAVTVLTSEENKSRIVPLVLRLANMAKQAGLDGVVCSVNEAKAVRKEFGRKFVIVTPGIRLSQDNLADQKRPAAPEEAKRAGSNYLVVGRPVLRADNPKQALKKIKQRI